MKNWDKPEVRNLGFENTYGDHDNEHFCHAIGDWHSTETCTHNHGGGNCDDPDHQWPEAHKSSCCCYGGPGLS